MKILIVNKFLYPNGGSETYIFKIGEQLKKMGHEVQYFGMEHEGRCVGNAIDCYTSDMDFHTGKVEKLLYPFKIIYSKEAYTKLTKVLENFSPDVVHINNFNFQLTPSIIYAIRRFEKKNSCRIRIAYTAHDYQWVCPNHMMLIPATKTVCDKCLGGKYGNCSKNKCIHNSLIKSLLGAFEAKLYYTLRTYEKVDTIICPSEFLKRQLEKYRGLSNKLLVMHNFENTEYQNGKGTIKISDSTEQIKAEEAGYVLYFGRYSEEKGIKTLLSVCKQLPNIHFSFAGGGVYEEEINQIGNIHNCGFLKGQDMVDAIVRARFVVFTSEWYENCPFSVMEAISYGTPVIGANIGGVPELIENNENGILYESGNAEELKEKIEFLWNNGEVEQRLREGCKNTKFDSLERYCEKLIRLYEH